MLLVFAGAHRMGSTYQSLIVRHAMTQLAIRYRATDSPEASPSQCGH
jgi:hypothetical protein